MKRKISEKVKKECIERSRKKVIEDLINKNIPFELIGSNPEFKNRASRTNFKCKKCGAEKIASAHNIINNHDGCLKCGLKKKRTFEEFKNLVESYGFSIVSSKEEIRGEKTEVSTNKECIFKHVSCGTVFKLRIHKFLEKGNHCPSCNTIAKKSDEKFLEDLKKHGDIFFLSDGDHYNGRHKKVTLTCKTCNNKTEDYAFNFLTNGRCCSFCSMSRSEQIIKSKFLNNIERNKTFENLTFVQNLFIDFQMNDILLECDGEQHFKAIPLFGGDERFLLQKEQDFTKDKYALENNLTLIRIHSDEIKNDDRLDKIFDSSTTIETFKSIFENILIIKDRKLQLVKGKYNTFKIVEYIQANGNRNEKDMV